MMKEETLEELDCAGGFTLLLLLAIFCCLVCSVLFQGCSQEVIGC